MPVSSESIVNVWSHEVTTVCTSSFLWKRFPANERWFCAAVSETSTGIDQRVLKLWNAGSTKLLAALSPLVLALPGMVSQYSHCRAHWFHLQWIARTIVWPYWNLTVGGRQYQCSHFPLVLCNYFCHHKTKTALHYSTHSLSTATHVHSRLTSHIISGHNWNLLSQWILYLFIQDWMLGSSSLLSEMFDSKKTNIVLLTNSILSLKVHKIRMYWIRLPHYGLQKLRKKSC